MIAPADQNSRWWQETLEALDAVNAGQLVDGNEVDMACAIGFG